MANQLNLKVIRKRYSGVRHWLRLAVLVMLMANTAIAQPSSQVRYVGKPRTDYYVELLQLALSYPSGRHYQLIASGFDMPKQRAFDLMNQHQGIDVMFGSASNERLNRYRAVPFALLKGLNGYRVALVRANEPDLLQHVHSLSRLASLNAGQFATWSDTQILKANQLPVETTTDENGLYGMLERGRSDYFPLSVLEVQQELEKHLQYALSIDKHLLLYYPTVTYFYVAKDNEKLAEVLNYGLTQALADGSYDKLFNRYFGEALHKLNLANRRILRLNNPLLPPDAVPVPPEQQSWFKPIAH